MSSRTTTSANVLAACALGLSLTFAACTTRLYPGPKRPDAEIAEVETQRLIVVAVDGRAVRATRGRFAILASTHSWLLRRDNVPRALCFDARGGHVYLVRPQRDKGEWYPEVIDENTTLVVKTAITSPVAPDCSSEASAESRVEPDPTD